MRLKAEKPVQNLEESIGLVIDGIMKLNKEGKSSFLANWVDPG